MRVFYGTGNCSKLRNMRALIGDLPIEIVTPSDLGVTLPEIPEDGRTPWENARIKADAYHKISGMPSLGLDSGLYIAQLPPELQPGTLVRRVNGKTLNDEEFIEFYSSLAAKYGGALTAQFINGLCVSNGEEYVKCFGGDFISTSSFKIMQVPSSKRLQGFPMDSIAWDEEENCYWIDRDYQNEATAKGTVLVHGVQRFFDELLKGNYQWDIEKINALDGKTGDR